VPGGAVPGRHTTLASHFVVVDVEIRRSTGYIELHDDVI
jgi:hypothetical protein